MIDQRIITLGLSIFSECTNTKIIRTAVLATKIGGSRYRTQNQAAMSEPGKLQSRRTFKATFYFWSTRLGQWEKLIVFDGEADENDEKLASKEKELKWPFYYQTTLSTQNWGHLFAPTAVKEGKRWTQTTKEDVWRRPRSKISTNGGFQNESGKTNRGGKEDLSERRKGLQSEAKKVKLSSF